MLMKSFCIIGITFLSTQSFAWGGRGHHTICDAAAYLVENADLKRFLMNRPNVMGHLCNIPDIYWYSLGEEAKALGGSTHFVDTEMLPVAVKDIPTDYKEIVLKYSNVENPMTGKKITSIAKDFGSNWWRADQFFRRALSAKTEKAFDLESFFTNLGLMGHFVGDNAQPFHSTVDYDGWGKGHGGIHAYYESDVVSALEPDLNIKIIALAKVLKKKALTKDKSAAFLNEKTVIEKMRSLSALSLPEIEAIYKADPVTKPSSQKEERGMTLKTPAERKSPAVGAVKMQALILPQMARSAALLSQLWDMAYEQIGKPELKAEKYFPFPLTPDFVRPDYTGN